MIKSKIISWCTDMEEYRNFFYKIVGERVFVYNYQMNHVATYAAKDDTTVNQRIDELIDYQDKLIDEIIEQLSVDDAIK